MIDHWSEGFAEGRLESQRRIAELEEEARAAYKRGHSAGRSSASDMICDDHRRLSEEFKSLVALASKLARARERIAELEGVEDDDR